MWTKAFWVAAAERAIRTFAQAFAALLVADPVIGLVEFDWLETTQVSALAALASVLTSVAAGAITSSPGPSLTKVEVVPDAQGIPTP